MSWMARILAAFAALALSAAIAQADFVKIEDRNAFARVISGKLLTRTGIKLSVTEGGEITGRAFGRPVTGAWAWQDGYFCRDLFWGKMELGYNCQQVALNGDALRFISDRGTGEFADLKLR